jgi:hypothetical protein
LKINKKHACSINRPLHYVSSYPLPTGLKYTVAGLYARTILLHKSTHGISSQLITTVLRSQSAVTKPDCINIKRKQYIHQSVTSDWIEFETSKTEKCLHSRQETTCHEISVPSEIWTHRFNSSKYSGYEIVIYNSKT